VTGAPDRPLRGWLALVDTLRRASGREVADLLVTLGIALVAGVIALALATTTPFRFVENFTYDMREHLGAPPAPKDFIIVKVDEASLDDMSRASPCHCLAPMDKVWLAGVIKTLDDKGVRAVLVDYLIDTWSSEAEFNAFQAQMATVKAPVIVGVDPERRAGVDYKVVRGVHYADARALVNSDYDDIMRRYDPKPGQLFSLAGELARQIGVTPPTEVFDIRYRAPYPNLTRENAGAIGPSYPATYVQFTPAENVRGKIALIGRVSRSAAGDVVLEDDTHTTPLRFKPGHEKGTPGVEIHAHALAQMIAGDRITKADGFRQAMIVLVAALLGAILGRSTQNWWLSIVIVFLGVAASWATAVILYERAAFMAPMTAPSLGFALSFFMVSRLAAAELQSQRAFYSSTLERYLAPQVIDRMVDGRSSVTIGAEEREITAMISDLENFSNLVASLDLATFTEVINEYLGGMLDILWKHEAMIDKMTGDGVIAIFGAPVLYADHADRAIACAQEIDRYAETIREGMIARGIAFGHTRMGISSGLAMVGNFGSEQRFNYTAYGETMVVAARLEAANKTFNTRILFSGATLALARNRDVPVRPVGEIDLKGVPRPIAAYTIAT
jgi:adenylate cyclase